MGMSLQQSKSRIKSIQATSKITKAMELVSTSKLKKAKEIHFKVTPFQNELMSLMGSVYCNLEDKKYPYLLKNEQASKNLYVLITSSLGLCGGYNSNLFHFVVSNIHKEDELIIFGSKGYHYFKNKNYKIVQYYEELPQFNIKEKLSSIVAQFVKEKFDQKEYQTIQLIYTKFINSLTFEPQVIQLLPLIPFKDTQKFTKQLLIEPNVSSVLDQLIPFYLTTTIKTYLFESMLSEQASRRTAMENATDNAFELESKLMLEYNKARQAMITQEISEISGSADALN